VTADEHWTHQAACHYTQPEWRDFWHSPRLVDRVHAKHLCRNACPVRAECHTDREAALDSGAHLLGVVAGTDYGWTNGYQRVKTTTTTDEEGAA
jgi:hypothetical protein